MVLGEGNGWLRLVAKSTHLPLMNFFVDKAMLLVVYHHAAPEAQIYHVEHCI